MSNLNAAVATPNNFEKRKKLQLKFISDLRKYDGSTKFYPYFLSLMEKHFDKKTHEKFAGKLLKVSTKKGALK